MYKQRELIEINPSSSMEQKCQDMITNWEIVCEENDYHRAFVSQTDWDQWIGMRNRVDKEITEMSLKTLGEIHDYLVGLNSKILRAKRVDVAAQQQTKEIDILDQAKELERNSKPPKSLIDRMCYSGGDSNPSYGSDGVFRVIPRY